MSEHGLAGRRTAEGKGPRRGIPLCSTTRPVEKSTGLFFVYALAEDLPSGSEVDQETTGYAGEIKRLEF